MTVRRKLFITVVILSTLAAVTGMLGLLSLQKFNENVTELSFAVQRVDEVQAHRVEFQNFNRDLYHYVWTRDDNDARMLQTQLAKLQADVGGLERSSKCPKCAKTLKSTGTELGTLETVLASLINDAENGNETLLTEHLGEIDRRIAETTRSLKMSAKMTNQLAADLYEDSQNTYRQYVLYMLFASILIIGVGLVLGYLMTRGIATAARELHDAATEFTLGDRDRRIETRLAGEFSTLADSFNNMAEQIQGSEHKLREWGEQLEKEVDERTDELRIANREIARKIQETKTYLEIARVFTTSLDQHETLRNTASTLSALLGADYASIALIDEESFTRCWEMEACLETGCPAYGSDNLECWTVSGTHCRREIQGTFDEKISECVKCPVFRSISVKIAALHGIDDLSPVGTTVGLDNTACGQAVLSLKPIDATPHFKNSQSMDLRTLAPDCASQISIPLITKNRVLGTIAFGFTSKKSFSDIEIELTTSLSNQLALGIENAIFYEKTRQAASDFSMLYKAGETMGTMLDENDIVRSLIDYALNMLQADGGIVFLYNDTRDGLDVAVRKNFGKAALSVFGKTPNSGAVGTVLRERKPLIIDKRVKNAQLTEALDDLAFRSALFAPLQFHGTVFGAIGLISYTARNFSYSDMRLFTTLNNLAGAAIHNAQLFDQLESLYIDSVKAFVEAIEAKDSYTRGHSENVANLAVAIARRLGLSEKDIDDIRTSALLHDIGKIGVREDVLNKPGQLDPDEYEHVREHPRIAYQIIGRIPAFKNIAEIILHHHERYDGKGYVLGIKGESIPLGSRILAVADTFDAMTSSRPYRDAASVDTARAELLKNSGTQFDPAVVTAFIELLDREELPVDDIDQDASAPASGGY